jgi:hypothetical protein
MTSHPMRRRDRELPEAEAYAILAKAGDGVLATMGADGYPYAVPLNHAYADGVLYLHSAQTGHKLENLEHCDRVSYCVVTARTVLPEELSTQYESAIVFGRAARVEDPEQKRRGLMALLHRFAPDHMESGLAELEREFEHTALLRLEIHQITGKARPRND